MSDFMVSLAANVKQANGTCEIRLAVGGGKYATFTVKDGETLTTKDPAIALAIASLGSGGITPLASPPTKPTHDVDTKPKADLPALSGTK